MRVGQAWAGDENWSGARAGRAQAGGERWATGHLGGGRIYELDANERLPSHFHKLQGPLKNDCEVSTNEGEEQCIQINSMIDLFDNERGVQLSNRNGLSNSARP